jgi:hypothetical protein
MLQSIIEATHTCEIQVTVDWPCGSGAKHGKAVVSFTAAASFFGVSVMEKHCLIILYLVKHNYYIKI